MCITYHDPTYNLLIWYSGQYILVYNKKTTLDFSFHRDEQQYQTDRNDLKTVHGQPIQDKI